jgi:hypothetical protein
MLGDRVKPENCRRPEIVADAAGKLMRHLLMNAVRPILTLMSRLRWTFSLRRCCSATPRRERRHQSIQTPFRAAPEVTSRR